MNEFAAMVDYVIDSINLIELRLKDRKFDFEYAIDLFTNICSKILPTISDGSSEVTCTDNDSWTSRKNSLMVKYEYNEMVFALTLIKAYTPNLMYGRNEISCILSLVEYDANSGEVYKHCTIAPVPTAGKKYVHDPVAYLSRMLHKIFKELPDDTKCYLYMVDSSIERFFNIDVTGYDRVV